MRNERLRALLLERGKSPDQLAEHVRVDAKTVERWITRGRLPYRRHRFEVASFLGVSEQQVANYRFAAVKKLTEQIRDAGLPAEVFPELRRLL